MSKGITRFLVIAVLLGLTAYIYIQNQRGEGVLTYLQNRTNTTPSEPFRGIIPAIMTPTVDFPESGTVTIVPESEDTAALEITSPDDNRKYFIILKSDTTTVEFYMRGSETITVDVPYGDYRTYVSTGVSWFGYDLLFGDSTECYLFDTILQFNESHGMIYKFWFEEGMGESDADEISLDKMKEMKGG